MSRRAARCSSCRRPGGLLGQPRPARSSGRAGCGGPRRWARSVVDEGAAAAYGISVGDTVPFHSLRAGAVRSRRAEGRPLHRDRGRDHPRAEPVPVHRAARCSCRRAPARHYGAQIERIDNAPRASCATPSATWPCCGEDVEPGHARGHAGARPPLGRTAHQHRHLGRAAGAAAPRPRGGGRRHRVRRPGAGPIRRRRWTTTRSCCSGLGFTRRDRTFAAVLPHLLTAAVALPVALVGAAVALTALPDRVRTHGRPERRAQPRLARDRAGSRAARRCSSSAAPSIIAWRRSGRLGLDVVTRHRTVSPRRCGGRSRCSVGLGTTMAFEAGRGRRSVPVRPALFGAVAGVLGIVGTFTIEHGLDDALANPERGGGHLGRDGPCRHR